MAEGWKELKMVWFFKGSLKRKQEKLCEETSMKKKLKKCHKIFSEPYKFVKTLQAESKTFQM